MSLRRTAAGLAALAAILASLAACAGPKQTVQPSVSADVSPSASSQPVRSADQLFTARYDAGQSFNPITGTDANNMALTPLLYEGLFVLNSQFEPENVLCDSYSTDDGLTYTFKLKPNIGMTDGSELTSADVRYSLTWARQTGRFVSRLSDITSVMTTDNLTVVVTLASANRKLPALLDVPIIKSGSIDSKYPPGTGPYYMADSGDPRLTAFSYYRDNNKVPVSTIYLKECSDTELPGSFSSQAIDLFWNDPGGTEPINILNDHDAWYYDTTVLQYIGFNENSSVVFSPSIRRAIGLAVDRESIAETALLGHAIPSPLVLSPKYKLYNKAWVDTQDHSSEISSIFSSIGLKDSNSDGFLEYPLAGGQFMPFALNFIVNADNKYKVAAAQQITDSLMSIGVNVSLQKLSWDKYTKALQSGSFDMYYGDVFLPADFDLSVLLAPGAPLDYGHAGSDLYRSRISAFLGASTDEAEQTAAQQLCEAVDQNAPIIPVVYREFSVHTNRNVVTGMKPTQSSIFYGLTSWKINLGAAS